MKFLKESEFVPFAPEQEGKVRINHSSEDCSGESKSMIVERKHDGSVFGYCHRCCKLGTYNSPYRTSVGTLHGGKSTSRVHRRKHLPVAAGFEQIHGCYGRSVDKWDLWPEQPRRWLKGYSISDAESRRYSLTYGKDCNALFLPFIGGWQARNFDEWKPKYYTFVEEGSLPLWDRAGSIGPDIVIVEDIISAIKVSRIVPAVSVLGVTPNDAVIAYLLKRYKHFTIFMDDDTQQVKKAQRALRNRLAQVGEARIITGVGRDPKECSMTELREILT